MKLFSSEGEVLLYRAQAARYCRYFAGRWRLAASSEELISLADLALCEALHAFRPEFRSRFTSYLFLHVRRVVHDALCDQIRAEKGRVRAPGTALDREEEDSLPRIACPEAQFARTQARENLLRALSVLEDRERQILHSLYIQDLPIAEAARRMRMSRMHLYTLRGRALTKLRLALLEPLPHTKPARWHNPAIVVPSHEVYA